MTARIPCSVPFCKATISRDWPYDAAQEAICTTHMKPVSKRLKAMHTEAGKRATAIMNKWTNPDEAPEAERKMAVAMIKAEQWLWKRIKAEAIEAAGGIA